MTNISWSMRPVSSSTLLVAAIMLATVLSISCGSHHYYYTPRFDGEMAAGIVHVSAWQDGVLAGEDIGKAEIDSSSAVWGISIYYWPSCRRPREVDIRVDSVVLEMNDGREPRVLERPRWKRYQGRHWTSIMISPISLPKGEYPDFHVSFNLRVYEREDDSLIDSRRFRLRMNHVQ